jgi:hypothetical protein
MTKQQRLQAERFKLLQQQKSEVETRRKLVEHIIQAAVKTLEDDFKFGQQRIEKFLNGVNTNM